MRRTWIIAGLIFAAVAFASAAVYQRSSHWKEFHYVGSRLQVDLKHPDALIRSTSLSRLPRDLLKVPIARDVLTQELAFYYEQQEDRLGLSGAIRRIAYEHRLEWSDRILAGALNAPATLAFWRDGKGALRHYALVLRRNALTKVLQQAATVALKDSQLRLAGELDTGQGQAALLALEVSPRRTLLLVSQGDRLVVLSDPGLLLDGLSKPVPEAQAAVRDWLNDEGTLAQPFELDGAPGAATAPTLAGAGAENAATPASGPQTDGATAKAATHTVAIGASTLALGYGNFLTGFKGLRFDFGNGWSSSVWIDPAAAPAPDPGDADLWRAAPANPGACVRVPVNWNAAQSVIRDADTPPALPVPANLGALEGAALACWYNESTLYAPVFIARLGKAPEQRDAALQALADWAIAGGGQRQPVAQGGDAADSLLWRADIGTASLGARGRVVAFSPDGALVEKVLDTLARRHPSVADQMPGTGTTLAVFSPRPLSAMAEREMLRALAGAGDANLLAAAQTHLPERMRALALYPPYRLELAQQTGTPGNWHPVQWLAAEPGK